MGQRIAPDARERIVEAALERFNYDGIRAVSADAIITRADVAKMTFYKHFPTKQHLAAAFVRERSDRWMAWLRARVIQLGRTPKQRLLSVFDALAEWFETDDYRGCPFHRAATEFPDPKNPIHKEVVRNKKQLRDYLFELASDAKVRDPQGVVNRLLILTAGSEVMSVIAGGHEYAKFARSATERLLK